MEEKVAFLRRFFCCVRELLVNGFFQVQGWERREENKSISEKAQSFWERGPCLCLLELDLVKCLFKGVYLVATPGSLVAVFRDCLGLAGAPEPVTQAGPSERVELRSGPAPTPRSLKYGLWAVAA